MGRFSSHWGFGCGRGKRNHQEHDRADLHRTVKKESRFTRMVNRILNKWMTRRLKKEFARNVRMHQQSGAAPPTPSIAPQYERPEICSPEMAALYEQAFLKFYDTPDVLTWYEDPTFRASRSRGTRGLDLEARVLSPPAPRISERLMDQAYLNFIEWYSPPPALTWAPLPGFTAAMIGAPSRLYNGQPCVVVVFEPFGPRAQHQTYDRSRWVCRGDPVVRSLLANFEAAVAVPDAPLMAAGLATEAMGSLSSGGAPAAEVTAEADEAPVVDAPATEEEAAAPATENEQEKEAAGQEVAAAARAAPRGGSHHGPGALVGNFLGWVKGRIIR
uniref:Uncharacterized protein n=1 Tax=Pyramimonas obovata TaxID=1411642 RepID=A0A7S0N3V5_9CHLO